MAQSTVAVERQSLILRWLEQIEFFSVAELALKLRVSEATIRRDLVELTREGQVVRTHGGVMSRSRFVLEPPYQAKATVNIEEKQRIGRQAAKFVHNGDAIFLNAGTTAFELARNLKAHRDLTVVTNAANIALELIASPEIRVMLTGGVLREKTLALVGPLAERSAHELFVCKTFLGINNIDLKRGIAMHSQMEAEANKAFIKFARENTVIIDASKFQTPALALIAPLTEVQRVITDKRAPMEAVDALRGQGIEVVLV